MASVAVAPSVIPHQVLDLSVKSPKRTENLLINFYQGFHYNQEFDAWQFIHEQGFLTLTLHLPSSQNIYLGLNQSSMAVVHHSDNPYTITVNNYTLIRHYDDHACSFHKVPYLITSQWLNQGANTIRIELDQYAHSRFLLRGVTVAGMTDELRSHQLLQSIRSFSPSQQEIKDSWEAFEGRPNQGGPKLA